MFAVRARRSAADSHRCTPARPHLLAYQPTRRPAALQAAFVARLAPDATGTGLEALYASGLYAGICYGGGDAHEHSCAPASGAPPPPPPVAPSRSAVKAAALALKRQLDSATGAAAVAAVVNDESGAIAAAAAEGLCWEVTQLPRNLPKPKLLLS